MSCLKLDRQDLKPSCHTWSVCLSDCLDDDNNLESGNCTKREQSNFPSFVLKPLGIATLKSNAYLLSEEGKYFCDEE